MKHALALASVALAAAAPASAAAVGGRSPLAVSVSPARATFVAPGARRIDVRNAGTEAVVVDIARRRLDGRAGSARWLTIRPAHLLLRSGATAVLTLRATSAASPGDHRLVLLLVARSFERSKIAVHLRVGIGLRIRMPGRVEHHLEVRGVRVRRRRRARVVCVTVANDGNVTEQLRGRLAVMLVRNGRIVSRLRLRAAHELFAQTRRELSLPYRGSLHGRVAAVVQLHLGGARSLVRRYWIRL